MRVVGRKMSRNRIGIQSGFDFGKHTNKRAHKYSNIFFLLEEKEYFKFLHFCFAAVRENLKFLAFNMLSVCL